MSDMVQPRLSTGQAAKVLGVHVSTVKRWFDEGGDEGVSPGSHRRIALDTVLAEGKARGYPTYLDAFGSDAALAWEAAESVDAGEYGPLGHLFYRWVKQGRAEWIGKFLLHCGEQHGLSAQVLDGAFGATLRMVGEAWEEGRLRVGEERAVSWQVAETLLELIRRAGKSGFGERDARGGREHGRRSPFSGPPAGPGPPGSTRVGSGVPGV